MNASTNTAPFVLPMLPMSDHEHRCVYRPSEMARMPLLYPTRRLSGDELDNQLAQGRRRSGTYLYYTACPNCNECRPTRLNPAEFTPSRSMRRVLNFGDKSLRVFLSPPVVDAMRLDLFNRHRLQRDLASTREAYSAEDFRGFLVESCCDSRELSYWYRDKLIACSIVDIGTRSLSAVYTFFDPDFSQFSLGTYSILKQLALTKELGRTFLYLGMYVEDNQHLRYKGRFAPQERYIDGRWIRFETPMTDWSSNSAPNR